MTHWFPQGDAQAFTRRTPMRFLYLEAFADGYLPGIDEPPHQWNVVDPESCEPRNPVMKPPKRFGVARNGVHDPILRKEIEAALSTARKHTIKYAERMGFTWTWNPDSLRWHTDISML